MSVVVGSGQGSFDIALPREYTTVWRAGTSPEELITQAARRDPDWADYARPRLTDAAPAGSLRAVALDGEPDDEVIAVFFTLTRAAATSGDDLAREITCEAPASRITDLRPVCAEMAATFRPLPAVSG